MIVVDSSVWIDYSTDGRAGCLIAAFCLHHGHAVLFSDRDFSPFVDHLGLVPA